MTHARESDPVDVETGLRRVARAERLLVVSDFDGTLAALVDHPDDVMPDPAAMTALRALSRLPDTAAAVLSGRGRSTLVRHLGADPAIELVGSHGAEFAGASPVGEDSGEDSGALLDAVTADMEELAGEFEGALVERKPVGVALHYRRVAGPRREEVAERARRVAVDRAGLRVQPGHLVIELVTGSADKGSAIDELRRRGEPTATVYVGDDRTDEHAFARLGKDDLAVRVGPGDTCASVRIPDQPAVAPLLERLRRLRVEYLSERDGASS